jgi:hypothetical protein
VQTVQRSLHRTNHSVQTVQRYTGVVVHFGVCIYSTIKMGLDQIRPIPLLIPNVMNMHGKLLNALQSNDLVEQFFYTCVHVCILYMYMRII